MTCLLTLFGPDDLLEGIAFMIRWTSMHETGENLKGLPCKKFGKITSGCYVYIVILKADFQSSHEAPRSSLRVHA
jgi:hypothetical protein